MTQSSTLPEDISLRSTFNQEAKLYDKARPHYPEALFEALVVSTGLKETSKLLEIGPGTGQATIPLARRGYRIMAIELGEAMAGLASRNLQDYPNVQVMTGSFENTILPQNSFDLIYAATAIHWIKPEVRYAKPHKLLKANGHLAIIHTNHVSDEAGDSFFKATQSIYEKYFPGNKGKGFIPIRTSDIKPSELDNNLFELVHFECFPLVLRQTAEQYRHLLGTFSPNLALAPEKRAGFLKEIQGVIEKQFNGVIDKHYAMSLTVAKKKP